MNRQSISRDDLKRNFLKEVIMRLDFQGVLQAEMDDILVSAKPYLKEKMFDRYEEKKVSRVIEEENSSAEVRNQLVYSFTSESSGYTVELSNTSIILAVHSRKYSAFDDYSAIFEHIANIYNETIDFFTVKRFGLRKLNFCFIKDRSSISEYFDKNYYNLNVPVEGYDPQIVERTDNLADDKSNINLCYTIAEGILNDQTWYKVTLDSDIYMTDSDKIIDVVFDKNELKLINEKLFGIYLNVVTDKFLEILTTADDLDTDVIQGVELNE